MKSIRQLHFYLGTFFAPAIFFFAFSGALQTFNLHESEDDGSYTAPAWIMQIASIHKDQRLAHPHHHGAAEAPAAPAPGGSPAASAPAPQHQEVAEGAEPEHGESHSSLPLKIFVLLLAVGLMSSAALGIYIALQGRNNRRMTWIMLGAGVLLPVALLLL